MQRPDPFTTLSERELEALSAAGTWYAKYHAGVIADKAADGGAKAVEDRREYLDLLAALGKLGVRVRVPDALLDDARAA
ncbi:MAG: hypothetical protein ACR2HC_07190 [Thermoleophilaceae bacterium]